MIKELHLLHYLSENDDGNPNRGGRHYYVSAKDGFGANDTMLRKKKPMWLSLALDNIQFDKTTRKYKWMCKDMVDKLKETNEKFLDNPIARPCNPKFFKMYAKLFGTNATDAMLAMVVQDELNALSEEEEEMETEPEPAAVMNEEEDEADDKD